MKKLSFYLILLFFANFSFAQIESGLLFSLTKGTSAEISAITGMEEGQMLYNTDTQELLFYNGTSWLNSSSTGWTFNGNTPANDSFLGSTNDVAMEIRANNIAVLETGRRQTLGLTQNYPDYTNNNQYLTHIKGTNGVSALQFQAGAASFYKPMFFTTAQGNFRLKGSAAGTDFFEIGSAGASNAGEMEFIIGDDGAEPFIFKRYDYRDQLLKELFRIQGSADTQTALPRVGINTGQLANSTLQINGSLSTGITSTNSNLTLNETHHTVIVNGNNTISFPSANSCSGRIYIIKNTNNVSINSSNYLNNTGATIGTIPANTTIQIQSNGTAWHAISAINITTSSSNTIVSSDTDNRITVGSDGGAFLNINQGARWMNTDTTTNLNDTNVDAPIFGTNDYNDDAVNLYVSTTNTLTIRETGTYDIRANLALLSFDRGRANVSGQITINGNPVGALASSGFIRSSTGYEQSSILINEILQLNANDVLRIRTNRTANNSTVRFNGGRTSSFSINKLK